MPFRFLEPGPLRDRELQLVEPTALGIDDVLRTLEHPVTQSESGIRPDRRQLNDFVAAIPRGRERGGLWSGRPPTYHFWMALPATGPLAHPTGLSIAGGLNLRVGQTEDLLMYLGQVGYGVYAPLRGHAYAERSVRLLFPLARKHGLKRLWITCNPDNLPSRRTCERLGGILTEIVDLPDIHPLYLKGERKKCRYRITL